MLLGANSCLNSKTIILFMLIVKTHKTKRKWSKRRSMPRDCCGFCCCWFWLCLKCMVIIFCFSFLHTLYHLLFFPHIIFHLWWEEHKTTTSTSTSIIQFPTWFSNGKKKSPFSYRVYFDRFQDIVAIRQRLFDFLFISFHSK